MKSNMKKRLMSITSAFLAFVMLFCACPLTFYAADTTTQGEWVIQNDSASGTASFGNLGFVYHSPTTTIVSGASGGKDYVKSNNTNGSATNGIVMTDGKSYCDFTAKSDGVLTVYVANASTKTGFVSKSVGGTNTAIGSFVPGGTGSYNAEGFVVTQGTSWATLDIQVQKDATYYITVSGSKMMCYGAKFVPNTNLNGTINDPFNLGSYDIKYSNKDTGESKFATVNNKDFSISLKPGNYSVALTGTNGTGYAISNDTKNVTVEASDSLEPKNQISNLTVVESISYKVTGTLTGIDANYDAKDMKLIYVPSDTTSHDKVEAVLSGNTYSAQLVAGETYTLVLNGANDYKLSDTVKVFNDNANGVVQNVAFVPVETYSVTGGFLGLGEKRGEYKTLSVNPTQIKFTNVDDKYEYIGSISNGTYSVSLRAGSYLASITLDGYTTSTHVVVKDGVVTRNLLLKDTTTKTVAYADTIYVGSNKEYKTIQGAVDAITAMSRTDGQKVTVKIDPGTYREQVVVNTPNVTFESNGGSKDNTKITWYYGIGYKYYSCVDSYYDPYADYDQFSKGDVVKYWGSAVITNALATGFSAKNITFENSFNKYMTDEEMKDGAQPNGLQAITVQRKETTNADAGESTERAAALVNYADKTEFLSCAFIGSQDTLYTCNVTSDAYYKNCYIEGQTDFIYGNGDVVFDGCEINFCGYDGGAKNGYLTANSSADTYLATDGYIFRNCYVSYGKRDVTSGYFGRMWGNSAKVAFLDTTLQKNDMIAGAGWTEMGTNKPTASTITLVEYNTTFNGAKVDTSSRVAGVANSIDASKYSVENVFINKGWTPTYYTNVQTTAPLFATLPSFTSNGDLNTPNPGETVTVGYELGSDWKAADASGISWYAVAAGYDNTSLDTILKSATLLKATSAVSTNKFQIPMDCAGKYLMAVVTPVAVGGAVGEAKYCIDKEKLVSSTWSDPDNTGSIAPGSGINIYLAGDSTVKDYSANGIYNGGKNSDLGSWGELLQNFFDKSYVTVNNYAQGGRSSRSFINEGKLNTIISNIKAGDYLLMQFGHNDCANQLGYYQERFCPLYTAGSQPTSLSSGFPTIKPTESMKVQTPAALTSQYGSTYYSWDCGATYKGYLQEYIDEALAKGAIPVIVTPVSRLYYTSGTIRPHHDATGTDYAPTASFLTENDAYVTACKELYEENKDKGVLFIDAYKMTANMYNEAYAAGGSDANGVAIMATGDKTHSNKTGGVIQAGLIAKSIQNVKTSVSQYVSQPVTAYGENVSGDYIFTIKNSVFTAKDNDYKENTFWTSYGQKLFDSLSVTTPEPVDKVAPIINGVTANQTYCTAQTVTVEDTNLKKVYVNGVEVTLTDGKFQLSASTGTVNNLKEIVAEDTAGNKTTVIVSVYDGHEYSYAVKGNIITETCIHKDCTHSATAKITATDADSTGSEIKTAKVEYSSDWAGKNIDIVYENNVNPGTATAKISIGGVTASVSFNITKKQEPPVVTIADYSVVDVAIARANKLTPSEYVDFSSVTAAINAVVRDYTSENQAKVDAMAKAINDAVAKLVVADADYTAVNKAVTAANALNAAEYKDFSAVTAAVAAVQTGLKVTDQAKVNAMAKTINDAIAALEKVIVVKENEKLTSDQVENIITSIAAKQEIVIDATKGSVGELNSAIFDKASKNQSPITIKTSNAVWYFANTQVTSATLKSPEVKIGEEVTAVTNKLSTVTDLDTSKILEVGFTHEGVLPSVAKVSLNIAQKYQANTKLYLYYFNKTTGLFELVSKDNVVTSDGTVDITLSHCSDYILSTNELPQSLTVASSNNGSTTQTSDSSQSGTTAATAATAVDTTAASQTSSSAAKTGDTTPLIPIMVALTTSFAGIIILGMKRKRVVKK